MKQQRQYHLAVKGYYAATIFRWVCSIDPLPAYLNYGSLRLNLKHGFYAVVDSVAATQGKGDSNWQ